MWVAALMEKVSHALKGNRKRTDGCVCHKKLRPNRARVKQNKKVQRELTAIAHTLAAMNHPIKRHSEPGGKPVALTNQQGGLHYGQGS